eukprot:c25768_g1_i2 orf=102-863(+)
MEVSLYPTFLPSNACCNRPGSLVNCCGSLPGRKDLLRRISVWTGVKEKVWAGGFKMMSTPSVWTGNKSGMQKLPFKSDGYNFWTWRGYKIHYVVQGEGLPVLLIHGFGASVFHWRYNVPELAKNFRVFAMDLLGFGLTEKALIDYSANVWRDQVADFVKEVIKDRAVLVGNRLMRQIIFQPSDLTLNKLLAKLSCPLLLVWGDLDPWMGSEKADKINHLYPGASVVRLQAGHCPHDEVPDLVNDALSSWISSL